MGEVVGGGAAKEQVCVFVCDGMQIQGPEGQHCSRNRRNKEEVGIYLTHAFSKTGTKSHPRQINETDRIEK